MADKKCPKCGVWNSESAEICDCGFIFLPGEKQPSPSKGAEYEKLFRESGVDAGNIRSINRGILARILLSLTIMFALPLIHFPPSGWIYAGFLLLLGVIIFINVYGRNKYAISVGLRIWRYALLGILAGFVVGWVIRTPLILMGMEGSNTSLSPATSVGIHWGMMYVFGLFGLWIGSRRVLKETTDYIR